MENNKKYSQPKIEAVKLNNQQAILAVCKIGGIYFTVVATTACLATGAGTVPCNKTAKGAPGTTTASGSQNFESFSS
ncbi:MAG: hypothetical protein PHQ52_08100 [Candidatus Omnitrophica bacterium]|nr:hypothetical protein [Candidatus Omnitrophota bacterium]